MSVIVDLRRVNNVTALVHVEIAFEDPLLELVGNVDWLGIVPDRSVHDGDALGASVSPATSRGRGREA